MQILFGLLLIISFTPALSYAQSNSSVEKRIQAIQKMTTEHNQKMHEDWIRLQEGDGPTPEQLKEFQQRSRSFNEKIRKETELLKKEQQQIRLEREQERERKESQRAEKKQQRHEKRLKEFQEHRQKLREERKKLAEERKRFNAEKRKLEKELQQLKRQTRKPDPLSNPDISDAWGKMENKLLSGIRQRQNTLKKDSNNPKEFQKLGEDFNNLAFFYIMSAYKEKGRRAVGQAIGALQKAEKLYRAKNNTPAADQVAQKILEYKEWYGAMGKK